MVPTLAGRLQTRIAVLAVVGGLWTLLVTPVLPGLDGSLGGRYRAAFAVLVAVVVLGLGWELLYHLLQQFRWEKDWPTLFGLVTAVPEGVVVWLLLRAGAVPGAAGVPGPAFLLQFVPAWLLVWLTVNGPMRVPFVRWRFRGGKLVG